MNAPASRPLFRKPLFWSIFGVALVLASVLVFWHFFGNKPVGRGGAGPAIPAKPFAKPWSTRPVYFLGLGDSIAAGYGARPGYGFVDRLAKNPAGDPSEIQGRCLTRVFPNFTFRNMAVSGSTSPIHADKIIPKIPRQNKETLGWVVMTTGGNDIIHNYGRGPIAEGSMYGATFEQAQPWIDNFRRRLDRMVAGIGAAFPGGCYIFLANIYDPTDEVGDIESAGLGLPPWPDGLKIMGAYNKAIAECAAKHDNVYLVDIHSVFLGHGIHCTKFWLPHYSRKDPTYWYYANLEDPNERGYDAIRRVYLEAMASARVGLKQTDADSNSLH